LKKHNNKHTFKLNNRVKLKEGTTEWMVYSGCWMRFSDEDSLDGEVGTITKLYKDCILVKLDNFAYAGVPSEFVELV
jgi:hypothetical protein